MRLPFILPLLTLAIIAGFAIAVDIRAQDRQGNFGIGLQAGDPSGITFRLYPAPRFSYDFLVAWDLDNIFFLNVHGFWERPIPDSRLRYFLGPGGLFGVDKLDGGNDVVLGISATVGLNFYVERFEVFLQATPKLNVVPNRKGDVDGGVGLRFYF